ncbi:unnamed protein product [Effrenium voratum]|uniref:Uncharacterized protein n=1 Tax=Effrenium voratum TaxID=2562239 RepID=A0AA36JPM3_9DINO|nr:unnamed protein product [Effrenium voratum]CAJ1462092.1 unnamed protein product [Effrenium voratum]|mmetsp:Transcript_49974/g.119265  ORF Transcript_49974/g.119265 Transcript_49974/m.119265 type:complete len:197 (+) Transcript_49974:43-633(+)
MGQLTRAEWIAHVQTHHALLGVFHAGTEKNDSFKFHERVVFLAMAVAAAWYGVYLKYFYLRRWIPALFDMIQEDLQLFPSTWLEDHIDSALCSAAGGAVDILLGKEVVRTVLKKDWQDEGGAKQVISTCCMVYAVALTAGAVGLQFATFAEKPHLTARLLGKWLITTVMKLSLIETLILTVKLLMARRSEAKGKSQ